MSYSAYEQWKQEPLNVSPEISIIIPAYNEEDRIVPTIGAIAAHMAKMKIPWELIIADDGSKDSTVQLVQELELANARVLIAEKNGGKGSAVRRGVMAANGRFLLFTDADNATPIQELDKLMVQLKQHNYDIAIGSRAVEGAEVSNKSFFRHLLSAGLNWIVRTLFRITVRDTQCGFKLYTHEAAQRLHSAQTINGFSFDLEILYLASKLGFKVVEVPVTWFDAPGSKVDPVKEMQRFMLDLVKIKANDIKGTYANA